MEFCTLFTSNIFHKLYQKKRKRKGSTDMQKQLCRKESGKKGFSMVEMMVVVAIIAILCAIGIPSIGAISRHLKFKQRNDYAESIFMAAQANLTELRSEGALPKIAGLTTEEANRADTNYSAYWIPENKSGFPSADWQEKEYAYTYTGKDAYKMILPPSSIDESVRDKNVIIEYNPKTGNVYSVFYCEEESYALFEGYRNNDLVRDEAAR